MFRFRTIFLLAFALVSVTLIAQSKRDISDQAPPRSDRSPNESSSKDNPVDLSAPMGDAKSHPNSGIADDVLELHTYDPHRAEKDIEVGDFYFKQKNYRAAESRYREALEWKPNDAIATFKLANALEKEGNQPEAEKFYNNYLQIFPDGPSAEECKTAIARMKNPDTSKPEENKKEKKKKK
jgi:Flp pilus assembly protein TadD